MKKITLLALFSLTVSAWGQDASEDAIILNQEMQFLEESAKESSLPAASLAQKKTIDERPGRYRDNESLEQKYFGEDSEDSVSSRTAAPKRRSY